MKKSLLVLFGLSVLFIALKIFARSFFEVSLWRNQILNLLYLWSPGFVGLYFAKCEKLALPLFKNIRKGFFLIPLYAMAIAVVGILLSLAFGVSAELNPFIFGAEDTGMQQMGKILILFFTAYFLPVIFMGILLFGGEIFWRGYLWEKLKKTPPFKALWIITFFWLIWQLPLTYFAYTPGYSSVIFNLSFGSLIIAIVSPLLFYFRLKYRAVLASALFYATLYSAFMWVGFLFHNALEPTNLNTYGSCVLGIALLLSLVLKLYSPKKWEQLRSK